MLSSGLNSVSVLWPSVLRLCLAAFLGGAIGLEREIKRRPAGLRTHLFICFGAALFTILSTALAGVWTGDHTRIAAQIIPGIGFIGAGSILHSRGSVAGLTTAATIFVVASIGMAAGGGLYLLALFATILVLVSLLLLGWVEKRFSLKPLIGTYQVVGHNLEEMLRAANGILAEQRHTMQTVRVSHTDDVVRIEFTVDASRREHRVLLEQFRQTAVFERVQAEGAERE